MPRIVVALGGNAVLKKGQRRFKEELRTINKTCSIIADLIEAGNRVVVTHGNGPQVGDILLQQSMARVRVPLDVCGAETQSEIGYLLQQQLRNELIERGINREVATVVTQVLVDGKDPGFRNPTKPIGTYYRSKEKMRGRKYIKTDKGYRRVVASPKPLKIIESKSIRALVDRSIVVIACGGGGIPVVKYTDRKQKKLRGVEAVIDKDLSAAMLGRLVGANMLLILTDVAQVYLNYKKKGQRKIGKMNVKQAEQYMKEGHFATGSMAPKIQAAINFLRSGGKKVIITSIPKAPAALGGKAGTIIAK